MIYTQHVENEIKRLKKTINYQIKDSIFSYIIMSAIAIFSFGTYLKANSTLQYQYFYYLIFGIVGFCILLAGWIQYVSKIFILKKELNYIKEMSYGKTLNIQTALKKKRIGFKDSLYFGLTIITAIVLAFIIAMIIYRMWP